MSEVFVGGLYIGCDNAVYATHESSSGGIFRAGAFTGSAKSSYVPGLRKPLSITTDARGNILHGSWDGKVRITRRVPKPGRGPIRLEYGVPSSCRGCAVGRFSTQINSFGCAAHMLCAAGNYTQAIGNASLQTDCRLCPYGKLKEAVSSSLTQLDACEPHRRCAAGYHTSVAGSEKMQPICRNCSVGSFIPTANSSDASACANR